MPTRDPDLGRSPVLAMTADFVGCTDCYSIDGVSKLLPRVDRQMPCGWAGTDEQGPRRLMIVALNPGHPMWGGSEWHALDLVDESGCRRRDISLGHAGALLKFGTKLYVEPGPSANSLFHRRSVAYAKACLWLLGEKPEDWLRLCWFTDAFKCSTAQETKVRIPDEGFDSCGRHLRRELSEFTPELVVALGSAAARAANRALGRRGPSPGKKPAIVRFLHPSRWRKFDSPAHDRAFRDVASAFGIPISEQWDQLLRLRGHLQNGLSRHSVAREGAITLKTT